MSKALTFSRPISRRGQVVVPKDVRVHLKIRDEVIFEVHDDCVVIRAADDNFLDTFLDVPQRRKSPAPAELKAIMGQRHANIR